ncbi:hypothetical protein RDV64_05790 [Acuticoccus sp. MNP-M23]|uniref:hypothetical protein n=1 Tax=Acuticoccus sp. MNP-M23 TaxID=3072793 RepID=UPI002814F352|nr:hypothetical protein [Acuticoccus sp. MNP-M23]WMS43902.1 hypothetical protein RDV64_05790 [Acuticoccus sp. MNP-M23]
MIEFDAGRTREPDTISALFWLVIADTLVIALVCAVCTWTARSLLLGCMFALLGIATALGGQVHIYMREAQLVALALDPMHASHAITSLGVGSVAALLVIALRHPAPLVSERTATLMLGGTGVFLALGWTAGPLTEPLANNSAVMAGAGLVVAAVGVQIARARSASTAQASLT